MSDESQQPAKGDEATTKVQISEQQELHGDGASDRYSNADPTAIEGADTEKAGVKQPDAMGAGEA